MAQYDLIFRVEVPDDWVPTTANGKHEFTQEQGLLGHNPRDAREPHVQSMFVAYFPADPARFRVLSRKAKAVKT